MDSCGFPLLIVSRPLPTGEGRPSSQQGGGNRSSTLDPGTQCRIPGRKTPHGPNHPNRWHHMISCKELIMQHRGRSLPPSHGATHPHAPPHIPAPRPMQTDTGPMHPLKDASRAVPNAHSLTVPHWPLEEIHYSSSPCHRPCGISLAMCHRAGEPVRPNSPLPHSSRLPPLPLFSCLSTL